MNSNFEKLILGCIISEPQSAGLACELVTPEMFSGTEKTIFIKINELISQGREIDLFILSSALSAELSALGGVVYLMDLAKDVASASKMQEYCLELKQQFIGKMLTRYFMEGSAMCENNAEIQNIMDFAQSGMEQVFCVTSSASEGFQHISKLAEKSVSRLEKRVSDRQEGRQIGIPSGLRPLDRLTNGWKGSELIVLASRPAAGKTATMLSFARAAAASGTPACLYSLEMSAVSLTDRMLMSLGNFNVDNYKSGDFDQWNELALAQEYISQMPIYIDANPKVTMGYIRNHSRIMKQKGKCGIIFIDYLQLADMSTGDKTRNREQEVAQTTRQCKILAKELDVPVVLLSQLSRETEKRADKRPQLSDLRESGAIEQDADIVMFLYRAAYYDIKEITLYDGQVISSNGIGEIIVAKHREGATGDIAFRHNESMTQIMSY